MFFEHIFSLANLDRQVWIRIAILDVNQWIRPGKSRKTFTKKT